jgi:hypothetical protein
MDKYADSVAKVKSALGEGFSLDGLNVEQFNAISRAMTYVTDETEKSSDAWDMAVGSLENAGIESSLASQIIGILTGEVEKLTGALDENAQEIWENASTTEMLYGVTADKIGQLEQAIKVIETLSAVENLNQQQTEMLAGAKAFLAEMFPHLNGNIIENLDFLRAESIALNILNDASADTADQMMANEFLRTQSVIENTGIRIQALKREESALRSIINSEIAAGKLTDNRAMMMFGRLDAITATVGDLQGRLNKAQRRQTEIIGHFSDYDYTTGSPPSYDSGSSSGGSSNNDAERARQEELRALEQFADQQIDLLQEMYDKKIELLEAERDKELDILDERLSNYEQYINDKIDKLNEEAETEDFESRRTELLEEQNALQNEIDILSLNDSESAQARKIALQEQLAELKKELANLQRDRDRKLREDNLQEELDSYQAEIEAQKEAVQSKYDSEIYAMQELAKNEQHFANLREQIIEGNMKNIQNIMKKYIKDFKTYNEQVIKDMGLSWQELQNIMYQYDQSGGGSGGSGGSGGGSNSSGSSKQSSSSLPLRKGNFSTPNGGWNLWSVVDYLKSKGYHATFKDREKLYKHFGGSGSFEGTGSQNSWLLKKLKDSGLKTGGYTGNNEGFKYLHDHELILKKDDTKNFLSALKYTRDLFKYIPNFDRFRPNFAGGGGDSRPINVYFGDVHNATKQEAESFGREFTKFIKRNGG